jgi:hypothetical protein
MIIAESLQKCLRLAGVPAECTSQAQTRATGRSEHTMANAAASSRAFSTGEKIFSEGDPGFELYVIRSVSVLP